MEVEGVTVEGETVGDGGVVDRGDVVVRGALGAALKDNGAVGGEGGGQEGESSESVSEAVRGGGEDDVVVLFLRVNLFLVVFAADVDTGFAVEDALGVGGVAAFDMGELLPALLGEGGVEDGGGGEVGGKDVGGSVVGGKGEGR